ncbi:hypothetical protein BKA62DRAFT_625432 [Auriculariales sp. MPI-PUGE-AT-0066]|nr:hypothetical protein BKA62DRAFT_625432 [Auriculariales sp. MPI-PUGE-AT-0066]
MREYLDYHAPVNKTLTLDGVALPPWNSATSEDNSYQWMAQPMREYLAWRLFEQSWRFLYESTDLLLIKLGHVKTSMTSAGRHAKRARAWGGGSYVPRTPNPLVADDWADRVDAVFDLYEIVGSWPEVCIQAPEKTNLSESSFSRFEKEVHAAFAQTFRDYYCRAAPVLYHRPNGEGLPAVIPTA